MLGQPAVCGTTSFSDVIEFKCLLQLLAAVLWSACFMANPLDHHAVCQHEFLHSQISTDWHSLKEKKEIEVRGHTRKNKIGKLQ